MGKRSALDQIRRQWGHNFFGAGAATSIYVLRGDLPDHYLFLAVLFVGMSIAWSLFLGECRVQNL